MEEMSYHLFLSCPILGTIWYHLRHWLDISAVDPMCLSDHFLQFGQLGGNSSCLRSTVVLIWLSCIWVLRKERDNKIFNNKATSIAELVDKVKFHFFWWLKAKHVIFAISYHCWWLKLLAYLSIACNFCSFRLCVIVV
jgi:hypothetical protein